MSTKQLGLSYGAVSDPLSTQIKEQGFKFDKGTVKHFELDADALNRLRIRGLLTDSQTDAITKKLHAKIVKHVSKENNVNPTETTRKQ